jgi:hypothetical protein
MPRSSQCAAILRRVASPPGEGGRMRQSAASPLRPLQRQPPLDLHRQTMLTRLHQLRGVGDAKVLKSLGRSPKGRHYRG